MRACGRLLQGTCKPGFSPRAFAAFYQCLFNETEAHWRWFVLDDRDWLHPAGFDPCVVCCRLPPYPAN
jgi:hypothetical protein